MNRTRSPLYVCDIVTMEELRNEVCGRQGSPKLNKRKTDCGRYVYDGFYFFSPDDVNNRWHEPRFIIARADEMRDESSNIVGVLKIEEMKMGTVPYTVIKYIDVKEDHKRQGVAKNLFRAINDILQPTDYLVGTCLSDEGERADLPRVIRENVTACPFFENSTAFFQFCYAKGWV